jgi:transcription initiation factor TFIIF subunit alpha
MNPSPASGTPGRTPGSTPNGAPRPIIRRQKPADPLVRRKPPRRPPPANSTASKNLPNNGLPSRQPNSASTATRSFKTNADLLNPLTTISLKDAGTGIAQSGFTTASPGTYIDYPVIMTKRQIKEGLRHHVARFHSKDLVDPSDEKIWTRPVRLHRRDPRAPAPGQKLQELDAKDQEIEEEREKQDAIRAQREAQRAADMAEVAPSMSNPNSKRLGIGQKKITQVFRKDETEEQRANSQLKYEEALPWHFEDFDNRQTWIGGYEAALSSTFAQFAFKDGKFYVAPVEKWYRFTQKRTFTKTQKELEAEEAKRYGEEPKWLQAYKQGAEVKKAEEQNRMATNRLYSGGLERPTAARRLPINKDREDADEIDFEEDVADDDEDPVYEGDVDEAIKETEKRIKKDQLQANIFDLKDEQSYDLAEELEKLENEARKEEGKRVRKALMKRERNYIYDTDTDNPYSESVSL